jgi:DEAD/DEAH box helicase domain-containing protein
VKGGRPLIDTERVLRELGLEFYKRVTEPTAPKRTNVRFSDLLPGLSASGLEIAEKRLYLHQFRTVAALSHGKNVILRSGTGSGKTEAWFVYAAKAGLRTLAIYPTLALSNDQIRRLRTYCDVLGKRAVVVDAPRKSEISGRQEYAKLMSEVASADFVVTNPAFLLNELKRIHSRRASLLRSFLEKMDLMVIDDLDFYGPRSLAILLAMVSLLRESIAPRVRFVVTTAMLKNADDLARFLSDVTGLETEVIDGEAFSPTNYTFVVLGKDLRSLWERFRSHRARFEESGAGPDVISALEDYAEFRRNLYKVLEVARAIGIEVEELGHTYVDVLERYADDEGLTIVFTRSIAKAEEVARLLRERVGDRVASHHHLLEKRLREEVEERARRGEVKVLVSPRTLAQGIDIGTVIRTVHIGLPESLREFLQKEGRKGRREGIERTETVIFPSSSWDYNLLRRGLDALIAWLELPREKVLVNPNNKYVTLVKGLLKLSSPLTAKSATKEELDLLAELGLRDGLRLNDAGKRALLKMNFYEFAPPFGIKRIRRGRDGERYLEEISHVDLVEKFQIGCIDYTSDGLVTGFNRSQSGGRTVTAVIVEDLAESTMRRLEPLQYVLEEYTSTVRKWGQEPSVVGDYRAGLLHSEVLCVVKPPEANFGKYFKIPNRTIWVLRSRRPKVVRLREDLTAVMRDTKTIVVPALTDGIYSDYTYGMLVEADPRYDPDHLRLGAAFIELVLRRALLVPLETIKYDVVIAGERKFVAIHETESAGLLEDMDWTRLKELLEVYSPDGLDEALLEAVNEFAYSTLAARGMDWEVARRAAVHIVERVLATKRIRVRFMGMERELPLPSRALRRAVLLLYTFQLGEEGLPTSQGSGGLLYSVAVFDGENFRVPVGIKMEGEDPDEAYLQSSAIISRLVDQGFKLYTFDIESLLEQLSRLGMRSLRAKISGLTEEGFVRDLSILAAAHLGESVTLSDIASALSVEGEGVATSIDVLVQTLRISTSRRGWRERVLQSAGRKLEDLARRELRALYLLSLILDPVQSGS